MSNKNEWLLVNAHILTMDDDLNQYEPGALLVRGDSIVAVGHEANLLEQYPNITQVDCGGKVLMPGLVNAHTHVPMTLLRGLADDLRLDVWLLGYMMPVERKFVTPEFVQLGTKIGAVEFIRGGVTTFNDMYYFEHDVAQASADAGLRAIAGQTVLKFPSPDADSFEASLDRAREFIDTWKNHPLIVPSVAPHAPYTCTPEILRACADLAKNNDVPLHIHISETQKEVEDSMHAHGMPVVPYVEQFGLFEAKVIAAHCVHINQIEQMTFHKHGTGVAHNPSSNLKLASGVAPVHQMLQNGLNVGIGTDGPSSNNDLDMFEEMRIASFIAKGTSGDPTLLPAVQTLLLATRIGAKALHLGDITGTLEVGKRADLILLDINPLHNAPRFRRDPNGAYAQIVYASKSTDVTDVMVNGQWLMRDKALTTLNERELLEEAADYANQIDNFLIKREKSVLLKLIAIEGAVEEESFEVQTKVRIDSSNGIEERLKDAPEIEILYDRHYRQYDSYFVFEDQDQGYLRYREDVYYEDGRETSNVRERLTLIGPAREHQLPSDVLLSRSRFIAQASHGQRFYREYFRPHHIIEIEKERLRWRIIYKDTTFYVNVDTVTKPDLGCYLEVKGRTWSRSDAELKAGIVAEIITLLGGKMEDTVPEGYVKLVEA